MFDEIDDATAGFEVTSTLPTEAHFVELSSDCYLRLTRKGKRMLRG